MKRKQQREKPAALALDALPWEVIQLAIVPRIATVELTAWCLLSRLSLRWHALVERHLQSDAVMRLLLPAPLGKRAAFAWRHQRCELGELVSVERHRLRMAACSARLFEMLAAGEWLSAMRDAICRGQGHHYDIPKEALSLLSQHQTRCFSVGANDLASYAPHLQLAHLMRHLRLHELTEVAAYAVARPWTAHSVCGRVFVHHKSSVVRDNGASPFVCDKHGKTLYLADLRPLMDADRAARAPCYEIRVGASTSKVHLKTGQELLDALALHFSQLYPQLREMVTAFGAMAELKRAAEKK
jgi:hypothetical protein